MANKRADIYEHANPNNAIVDGDGVRGMRRTVATLAELYALDTKADQLKEQVTIVYVTAETLEYKLLSIANIKTVAGWEELNTDNTQSWTDSIDFVYNGALRTFPLHFTPIKLGAITTLGSNTSFKVLDPYLDYKYEGTTIVLQASVILVQGTAYKLITNYFK